MGHMYVYTANTEQGSRLLTDTKYFPEVDIPLKINHRLPSFVPNTIFEIGLQS